MNKNNVLNQIYSLIYEGKYEEADIKILKYKQKIGISASQATEFLNCCGFDYRYFFIKPLADLGGMFINVSTDPQKTIKILKKLKNKKNKNYINELIKGYIFIKEHQISNIKKYIRISKKMVTINKADVLLYDYYLKLENKINIQKLKKPKLTR